MPLSVGNEIIPKEKGGMESSNAARPHTPITTSPDAQEIVK